MNSLPPRYKILSPGLFPSRLSILRRFNDIQTHLKCRYALMVLGTGIRYLSRQCQLSITLSAQQTLCFTEELQCT